ncbi:MAG: hypothetical protein QM796_08320 [Chthoniobacteraceae bacterium]
MNSLRLVGLLVLLAVTKTLGQDSSPSALIRSTWVARAQMPVPEGARLTVSFDRPEYFLGENVLLQFVLENTGTKPFRANFGGDYRGSDRSLRFEVVARNVDGKVMPETDLDPNCFGGMEGWEQLEPGKKYVVSLPLMSYCRIDQPGRYTIRATHDLGWKSGDRKVPVAETTVTFKMPNAKQAEQIITQMEKLSDPGSGASGTKSADYADFRCLRLPIYLNPLVARVKKGDQKALTGLEEIPTPEATQALIDLASQPDPAQSLAVAQSLASRLPDPEFNGGLPSRGPAVFLGTDNRQQLSTQSWPPAFADAVRKLALKFLARKDTEAMDCGAVMIQAVGTPEDAPAVFATLEKALQSPDQFDHRRHGSPAFAYLPSPFAELLRASNMLYNRGYYSAGLSGDGQITAYFAHWTQESPHRPDDWLENERAFGNSSQYAIRQTALQSIPTPFPDSCLPLVQRGLNDPDIGVCMTACAIVGKSGRKEFYQPLWQLIVTESDPSLLEAASNAAVALGGGYELYAAWADRMADQDLQSAAFGCLDQIFAGQISGSGGNGVSRSERIAIRDAWRKFLSAHEAEIRAGKKFKVNDPAVPLELFGKAHSISFRDGTHWPPNSN